MAYSRPKHPRTRYPQQFKDEAVHKILNSGLPQNLVAAELGIPKSVLSKWVKRRMDAEEVRIEGGSGEGNDLRQRELEQRVERLEIKLDTLRRMLEKAFLEKTTTILGSTGNPEERRLV